jgi:hypothetical protein
LVGEALTDVLGWICWRGWVPGRMRMGLGIGEDEGGDDEDGFVDEC